MNDPMLVTMRGPEDIDLRDLSNFEVGYLVLSALEKEMPGMTWMDLADLAGRSPERMGTSWFRKIGHAVADASRSGTSAVMDVARGGTSAVMDVGRGVGGAVAGATRTGNSFIGDAFDAVGDKLGDAVRLMATGKVMDSATEAYRAFSDGGGVAGFWGTGSLKDMFNSGEGGDGESQNAAGGIWDFIVNLGAKAKGAVGGTNSAGVGGSAWSGPTPWIIAGGGVVLLWLLRRGRH